MLERIFDTARRSYTVQSITGGAFGSGIYGTGLYGSRIIGGAGSGIDFSREAGNRWDASIVMAILMFARRNIASLPLQAYRKSGSGKAEVIPNHPATILLKRPNPWYGGSSMQGRQIFGEMSWGSSYTYKHRAPSGQLVALEVLPQGACYPYTWPGRGEFISEYRVATPMGYLKVAPADILHLRYADDPINPTMGLTPLAACFPELVADKMAQRHQASVLDNGAVSTGIFAPKSLTDPADPDSPQLELSRENATQLQTRMRESLTKDGKGGVFVSTFPLDHYPLQWSPDLLNVEHTTSLAEQRLCGVFGFQPVAVGFGTGLRESNNRASLDGAITYTFQQGILPYARERAEQLTQWLIPELGDDGEVIMYDESHIQVLVDALMRQLLQLAGRPILSLNEARAKAGYEKADAASQGDTIPMPKGMSGESSAASESDETAPRTNGKLAKVEA